MLPLIIAPQNILRDRAADLNLPLSQADLFLAEQMKEAMVYYKGIGLAAPQVNESKRLIVLDNGGQIKSYFNPEILKSSWRKVVMEEGCLSI
ncbi:MAG: peptide deformylase, partial [Patescibacteria group bacterium]